MFLQDSHNNTVQSNEITDCESSGTGIYLRRSHSNDIIENTADSNSYNGLWAIESNENVINGNLFRENGKYGMVLYESNHNYLTENTASNNVQNDGITLSYSNYNVLSKNNASSNGANGIRLMNEASNNTVFKNTLRSNLESGVKIESKCSFNLLFFNNFIANALNGRDDGMNNSWDDDTLGNYWDDHDGLDVDEDGIGDNPYYIAGAAEAVDHFPLVNNVYSGVITIEETAEDSEDDSANDPEGSGGVIGDITTWLFTPVGMITLAGGITLMGAGMGIILMKKKGIGPFSETKKDFSSERTTESEGLLNEPTNNSTDQS